MKIKILIILIIVLFSLGCTSVTPKIEPEAIDYHKGFIGLKADTAKNLPPKEIMQGNDFVIGLELENKGAFDISEGRIYVYGFEQGYVAINQPIVYFDVEGKKPGFPEGGYEIINIKARNIAVPEISETYPAAYTIKNRL